MRRFGLIGRTLGYSFSKGYFTDKFQKEGRTDCVYENYELDTVRAFPLLLERHPDIAGLNVTIPYKKEILQYLDTRDAAVAAIGACNTIRVRNGRLEGFNTDAIGFRDSLQPLLRPGHRHALVLGTGGAAAAIHYVLGQLGISVTPVSRQRSPGNMSYADLDAETMERCRVIINTTPLGTWPDVGSCPPIPYQLLGEGHLLYDLVYNPEITTFLRKGQERGAAIKNGYEMLLLQAEASWRIWNGE
ncbi:shikimate dehydrogenase [Flaviaesturariibacter flavus]|uniref:Shikimate dehydrogenase n=1 Tax=Flaviaesturariibacter flavus TaxID=2502780 RepID=A0A4R1BJT8_9BACT|nr:shikimate dehydrogenase [Flaviaesturariibacter flavus]TCJ17564.1 shikimate dehydrogenase [Flaviaesturariibacter flavus]